MRSLCCTVPGCPKNPVRGPPAVQQTQKTSPVQRTSLSTTLSYSYSFLFPKIPATRGATLQPSKRHINDKLAAASPCFQRPDSQLWQFRGNSHPLRKQYLDKYGFVDGCARKSSAATPHFGNRRALATQPVSATRAPMQSEVLAACYPEGVRLPTAKASPARDEQYSRQNAAQERGVQGPRYGCRSRRAVPSAAA